MFVLCKLCALCELYELCRLWEVPLGRLLLENVEAWVRPLGCAATGLGIREDASWPLGWWLEWLEWLSLGWTLIVDETLRLLPL